MSLDFYLNGATTTVKCTCITCFHEHERQDTEQFFSANITHNLGRMAGEAGIYACLWRPEENGISKASRCIEPLEKGLALMEADPERFKKFNASNGWGLYENFVPWVREVLHACREHPEADVYASR